MQFEQINVKVLKVQILGIHHSEDNAASLDKQISAMLNERVIFSYSHGTRLAPEMVFINCPSITKDLGQGDKACSGQRLGLSIICEINVT